MSNSSKPLLGRTALVTGSSSGIGRAIALRMAEQGANLILHGRSPSPQLEESVALMTEVDSKVECLTADFSELEQLENFLKTAWNCFYGIDILVNNAGADVLTGDPSELPFVEQLERVWQVDVRATLIASREIGRRMTHQLTIDRPHRRSILNIGWDQAWQGMAGDSGEMFAVSKGAIMSMTRSLAQSLAPNVRVNCLAPGWIKTKWGASASDQWTERAVSDSLMERWGTPEDVANMAAFISSDEADFVSGQIIPVNGGFRYFKNS